MPQLIAAARLQTALGVEIRSTYEFEINKVREDILAALETPTLRITTPPENRTEADAWIAFLRLKRRQPGKS